MVSISNNVGTLGHLNSSKTVIKQNRSSSSALNGRPKENFSSVLNTKTKPAQAKQIEKNTIDVSDYSPLMMRYGVNKINEIQNIAKAYGIDDLTTQDFDYAIRYGRSLLADYLV